MTECYHCGLAVPANSSYSLLVSGSERAMCCPGCLAVAGAITEGGLENFYAYRSQDSVRPQDLQSDEFTAFDLPEVQQGFVTESDGLATTELLLEGISCAACAWLIEKHLQFQFSQLEGELAGGLVSVRVNVSAHKVFLSWKPKILKLSQIMAQCQAIGYRPHPATEDKRTELLQQENKLALRRLGVAGIGMMQVGMVAIAVYAAGSEISDFWQQFLRIVTWVIATPVVFYSAQPFFRASWNALKTRHLVMDVPVALAVGGAYAASTWVTFSTGLGSANGEVYFDSIAMFTFFLLLGRYFEMRIRHQHAEQLSALSSWLPLTTRCKKLDEWQTIPTRQLQIGDIVQVRPGETIPCDGLVVMGQSRVVEAALTGEAEPVVHGQGDSVIAGTINTDQVLEIRALAVGKQTRLSSIEDLVTRAQQDKPRFAQLADRLSGYFVATVLVLAAVVFAVWQLHDPERAVWVTLSVLVVTCPCALSLATPVALTAAVSRLRSLGLLVTRGHVIETLPKISRVVFDKTGTLTEGKPSLQQVRIFDEKMSETQVLEIIAALEASQTHPIARAFDQYLGSVAASDVLSFVGQGVSANIEGRAYRFGRPDFAQTENLEPVTDLVQGSPLLLCRDGVALAYVVLADSLRKAAKQNLADLPLRKSLLSGDVQDSVDVLATILDINDAHGGLSPEQKLQHMKDYQQRGERVLMVGDGINDVPVLSGADISVAMGGASDLTRIQADAVLLNDDLAQLNKAFQVAGKARGIIRQNLVWALGYNFCALPLAAMGLVPPWLAAVGMSGSSLLVVVNALRLR